MPNGTDKARAYAPRPNKILAAPATVDACAGDLRPNDPAAPNGRQHAAAAARTQFACTRAAAR